MRGNNVSQLWPYEKVFRLVCKQVISEHRFHRSTCNAVQGLNSAIGESSNRSQERPNKK